MTKVIAITGPSGVGKTTVAKTLTKKDKNFVNIDVDDIKHMNPNAFKKVIDKDGEADWPYSEWELVGENTAILANNFLKHGYDVIINGYLEVEAWRQIQKHLTLDNSFLLLPDVETNILRDAERTDEVKMGEKAVKRGQQYFMDETFYDGFTKLDTSSHTLDETIKSILEAIN